MRHSACPPATMTDSLDLFVFADALGWRIVEENGVLVDLLPHRAPCETVFGYSSTCDPTILTGAAPRDHGHFSFFVKADAERPFRSLAPLRLLPHRVAGHHRVRHHLSKLLARRLGYTGYFMLYSVPFAALAHLDYTEKRDIYQPGGIIGGQPTIFERWSAAGIPWHRSDWRRPDAENIAEAAATIDRGEARLLYLFTSSLDATMHAHGTRGPEVEAALRRFETDVRDLYHRARRRYRDVRVHVFSDHGMADTERASDLMPRFAKAHRELGYGTDYLAVWDSTMARFWFGSEGARQQVTSWLDAQPDGRIVAEGELRAWGCDFPDRRYGELFYLLPAGTILAPSFMNLGFVRGMHGYDPAHPDSAAAHLTNAGPDELAPRLADLYGIMAAAADRAAATRTAAEPAPAA